MVSTLEEIVFMVIFPLFIQKNVKHIDFIMKNELLLYY